MQTDRPLLGIMLMLCFCLLAPLGDALAKLLGSSLPLALLLGVRFLAQALLLGPVTAITRRPWRLRGRLLYLSIWRTMLHIAGIWMMFSSLRFLPLADAIAIVFVMPFIMLLLGKFVLKEHVGTRRLSACVVGFIGTLLVIQPSFAEVGAPALLPLGVAVVFSLFMLVTRQIAKDTDPIALQAVTGAMASALLLPLMVLGTALHWPQFTFQMPSPSQAVILLLIGVVGTAAHLVMTWSLRFAPSATLAPMQYLEIPIATAIGWLIFRDLPNGLATVGIAITMASGLYIVFREQASHRQSQAPAPQSPAPPAAE